MILPSGLLSNDSLAHDSGWRDEGCLIASREGRDNWNAIDPNFAIDDNGKDMTQGGGKPVIEGDKVRFEAAGHSAAYHFPDGDVFICHGYRIPRGESVLIQRRITWKDGWPVLSPI